MKKDKDYYLDWIYNRGNSAGKKRNLDAIKELLKKLGDPQDKIKVIHIAGTNGKGSTANFIASTLSLKVKCGLFTSPYMKEINEEITINGKAISDDDFFKYIDMVKPICENLDVKGYKNTYFETLTAIMYKYFYDKKVDVAVVEAGLGGLLDSTNVVKKPIASLITTISMDHTNILGNTIEEISINKAGIIKEKTPLFLYPQKRRAFEVIRDKVLEKNSQIITFNFDDIKIKDMNNSYNLFDYREYKNIKTKLIGEHQVYNATNAINLLDYFKEDFSLDNELIKKGIYLSANPGRLEMICKNPRVLIDGSHNKESIDYLIKSLKLFKYERLIIGFSVLKDKDYSYIIDKLSKLASKIIITKIDNPRAFSIEDLENEIRKKFNDIKPIEDRKKAYDYSKKIARENDLVLWCGSLYLVGEILKYEEDES
ncbi:bifunctional folylpolyglutamate synthase/dihydrofolate synthase [Anaerococcus sp. WCA-380-WT-2B]|uniref:tetrahydrofolate synthase n=1 Tax=Anaerococcus porci TaxID=2652269 RepID=A0A6N7VXG8_9FIRM|nr:folylpolyglutamate synthase/dihydrofolate synthase family protein [Anaerococcus porci]MSS78409.1 bifunctional folylpolyglutamate synthase/dihydrofolate synthase [Anaerococcus porci]